MVVNTVMVLFHFDDEQDDGGNAGGSGLGGQEESLTSQLAEIMGTPSRRCPEAVDAGRRKAVARMEVWGQGQEQGGWRGEAGLEIGDRSRVGDGRGGGRAEITA